MRVTRKLAWEASPVWLGRGPVTVQVGNESSLGHYELRASVFLELLLQAGQGDGMGKTIMKARKK